MSRPRGERARALALPARMEAREGARGTSYRVKLPDGRAIPLGRNLADAVALYETLMPKQATGEALAAELWTRHRKGAAARGIDFELTVADVQLLLDVQKSRCAVTMKAFSTEKPKGFRIRPWAASIDRRDSTKGYVAGNCRIVCAFVNISMNHFGDALFDDLLQAMIRKIVRQELMVLFPKKSAPKVEVGDILGTRCEQIATGKKKRHLST